MIGKLKNKLVDGAKAKLLTKVEEVFGSSITEKVDTFKSLKPADVNDDDKYRSLIVKPIWTALQIHVATIEAPAKKFGYDIKEMFEDGLFNVRNELIRVEDDKVKLDPEFNSKVAPTLAASFKKKPAQAAA